MIRHIGSSLALVLILVTTASAVTFTVNSTTDAVDATPGDGTCAAAGGACTLRAAVQEANALAGADEISLPAGTFLLSLVGSGEDAAATGDLDVTQPLTVTGASAATTIIDGLGSDRIFHVVAGQALTVRTLTVRNGKEIGNGGGIVAEAGVPLTIADVTFHGNRADSGGAIFTIGTAMVVTGSRFESNVVTSSGGAVAVSATTNPLDIRDSTFENNSAAGGTGGALIYGGTGTVTIAGSTFHGDSAETAGAMAIISASAVSITDTVVENASASGAGGNVGGIYLNGVGSATLSALAVRGNDSANTGGGLVCVATGNVTLTDSTIEDNTSIDDAGGIYVVSSAGNVTIERTVIRNNRSLDGTAGGGLVQTAMVLTVRDVTVADNSAASSLGGFQATAAGSIVVERSRFTGNHTGAVVGGVYLTSPGTVSFTDSTVQANEALDNVAGAYLVSGGGVTVTGSTFADNMAFGSGISGGLYLAGAASTVTNSTFSNNFALVSAAGLYTSGSPVVVTNSTFVGNTAGGAGAAILAAGATVTLRSTVIGASDTPSCVAALLSDGDNVDQDGSCLLTGARDRSGLDPLLGPLADNGGPTLTHEPLAGSPLIDGVGGGACPVTDQRGVARPTDGNSDGSAVCDIGAVEFVDECPTDPDKRLPGVCGCGVPDVDANTNGAVDCLVNAELKARIVTARTVMSSLTGVKSDAETAAKAQLTELADGILAYCTTNEATIVLGDPSAKLVKLAKKVRKALRATRKGKGTALVKKQTRAGKALDALDVAVAPQAT
ncbi:MAG TPA: choice-of-anchor Q domain-containing protein [Candidatus Binatia bacterium]|jgi:CSLREA domain-containing protein|nr:choice-of-anchor Q domain-containing protein [Candidatus Binatia bacterium]